MYILNDDFLSPSLSLVRTLCFAFCPYNRSHSISIRNKRVFAAIFYNHSAILSSVSKSQQSAKEGKNASKRRANGNKKELEHLLVVKQNPFGFSRENRKNQDRFRLVCQRKCILDCIKNRKQWEIFHIFVIYGFQPASKRRNMTMAAAEWKKKTVAAKWIPYFLFTNSEH